MSLSEFQLVIASWNAAKSAKLKKVPLCSNCWKNPANDCGHISAPYWECDDPDDKIECPCELTYCNECRKAEK